MGIIRKIIEGIKDRCRDEDSEIPNVTFTIRFINDKVRHLYTYEEVKRYIELFPDEIEALYIEDDEYINIVYEANEKKLSSDKILSLLDNELK